MARKKICAKVLRWERLAWLRASGPLWLQSSEPGVKRKGKLIEVKSLGLHIRVGVYL